MLETRNLKKVYKTKKGVSVTALNDVSIKFPEKGLVFLLGKSGSGKSTLLNLLGGLDKYDEGEIIIKGVSSKDFKQSHFDSYRNTYVGFIFQEYNVLEEFSVGANIALAIELQGKKATDEEINRILKQVDLEGFGDRKPNELSGGQKQRVAIARALVKQPEIIMADEPTGALDSNTGRQVFETLKNLSKDKLVIVVSHDREFAEQFGDRIIELADGNVIDDVTRKVGYEKQGEELNNGISFENDTMTIKSGYHLTEEDRERINQYIDGIGTDLKAVIKKADRGSFQQTNEEDIVHKKGNFKLIKSKLPLKNAFKIGASGLKHKKIRLVVTILLSFVAFSLFALADTFGNYNHIKTCTNSIKDTNITYASVIKSLKIGSGMNAYWSDYGNSIREDEITKLNKDTGLDFTGVVVTNQDMVLPNYNKEVELTKNGDICHYATDFSGYANLTESKIKEMGYKIVAGKLPKDNNEIAISSYVYETYAKAGYISEDGIKSEIKYYNDLVGKKLKIDKKEFTIVGIVDTKVDMDRYKSISEDSKGKTSAQNLTDFALSQELAHIQQYSLACDIFVSEEMLNSIKEEYPNYVQLINNYMYVSSDDTYIDSSRIASLSEIDTKDVTWVDGEKTKLADNEIIIDINALSINDEEGYSYSKKEALKILKDSQYTLDYYINDEDKSINGVKVVGVLNADGKADKYSDLYVLPDSLYNLKWTEGKGEYSYAVATMPTNKADIEKLVKYCYTEQGNMKYQIENSVTFELDTVNEVLKVMSKVFLYIGIGFAVFAMIMLSNFIATSISYKKQEIGILRAIGARSNDVFRIFFLESFIIAMINFVLSTIGTGVATAIINGMFRKKAGILITILNFGPRQILLLLVISIGVAAVASFIPVYKIASKRPIEAIRNR